MGRSRFDEGATVQARPIAQALASPGLFLLFAALYGGYGALSPFLPAFLQTRGLTPPEIATLLAAAMLVRMAAGPLIGALADRTGTPARVLALSLAAAGALTLAFLTAGGFPALLAVGLLQAVATAPMAPLADALALARRGLAYGPLRATGSAAFIATSALTGWLVGLSDASTGPALGGALFVVAAGLAWSAHRRASHTTPRPEVKARGDALEGVLQKELRSLEPSFEAVSPHLRMRRGVEEGWISPFRALLALPRFRRIVLAAACIVGAHAMHDAFAVIVWTEAGSSPGLAGLLWAESVAAEIAAFLWFGPRLVMRFGTGRTLILCALAGALRWAVQAQTSALPALIAIQALHGLTFATLHLACLSGLAAEVPERLRATALNLYGNLGLGLASALTTLAAGPLYAAYGPRAFLAMSGLSLCALPLAWRLRDDPTEARCVSQREQVRTGNKDASLRP